MPMQFSTITLQFGTNGRITMTPVRFYEITDHHVKYIVMYHLKFTAPDISDMEATIPYYVSDGTTNKLRANMLYPFMCYSSMSQATDCPYNMTRTSNQFVNILLKYSIIANIDIDALERRLFAIFREHFQSNPEEVEKLRIKLTVPRNKDLRGNDLISVLQRITNLIDFLICISCDSVREFTVDERQEIEHGKYCPLSQVQMETGINYADLSIPGEQGKYMYKNDRNIVVTDDARSPFNAHFRLAILATLHSYYQSFVDSGIVQMTQTEFTPEPRTVAEFNKIAGACNKRVAQTNIKNYKIISVKAGVMTAATTASQESMSLLHSVLKITSFTSDEEINEDALYNSILNSQSCVSERAQIGKKNVYEMTEDEMKREIDSYSHFVQSETTMVDVKTIDGTMASVVGDLGKYITQKIEAASMKPPSEKITIYRNILLDIRMRKMGYNYIGQLRIIVPNPHGGRSDFVVDVDSSTDTLSNLTSSIRDKLKIDPSLQHQLSFHAPTGTKSLVTDSRTIAEHKIPKNSRMTLVISQPTQSTPGGGKRRKTRTKTKHKTRTRKIQRYKRIFKPI
jgi:cell fate (sporulation/competence/biofilm development) regulator YlbF (YheA/YmcA/DUF963 family)